MSPVDDMRWTIHSRMVLAYKELFRKMPTTVEQAKWWAILEFLFGVRYLSLLPMKEYWLVREWYGSATKLVAENWREYDGGLAAALLAMKQQTYMLNPSVVPNIIWHQMCEDEGGGVWSLDEWGCVANGS